MVSLYKTHGSMCTSVSKSVSKPLLITWPSVTNEADRVGTREVHAVRNGADGASRTDGKGSPDVYTDSSGAPLANNSDLIPHPAARALQMLGYPCEDIQRVVQHLQYSHQPVTAEGLLDLINDPENSGWASVDPTTPQFEMDGKTCDPDSETQRTKTTTGVSSGEVGHNSSHIDSGLSLSTSPDAPVTNGRLSSSNDSTQVESKDDHSHNGKQSAPIDILAKENQRLKFAKTCKVCLAANVHTLLFPCRHLVCCKQCANSVRDCPVCRQFIIGTVNTYMA